ncbi:MAG: acyl-CoA thioesterase [Thermoplasmata archaeon]|nr:acyl-CoA thioesterase [Thermoplasmata archaeon]
MRILAALLAVSFAVGLAQVGDLGQATPQPGPIVAFGDSLTAGFGASANESYPAVLAADLGIPVLNMGISGQTAEEALARLQDDVIARHPRLVVIAFGANEAMRGYSVASCTDALDRMLTELQADGIPVVLVGVRFWIYQTGFEDALRELAARHGTGLVLDVLDGLDGSRYSDDGLHPNGVGYLVMESRIRPEVQRVLAG